MPVNSAPRSLCLLRLSALGDATHAVALVRSMGWTQVFDTARMYRGGAIEGPPDSLYGIASLELG